MSRCLRLLRETRLLTLVGSAGCGKTRLALETARTSAPREGFEVCVARLAPLRQVVQVRSAIEAVLPRRTEEPLVLIVDNCEHVLRPLRSILPELLATTPQLRIVATSREPLGLRAEYVWRIPALSVSDAVRLFVDRATIARPDFALDASSSAAVSDICRALDGIPLAIELAAARLRHLTLEELHTRIHSSLALLRRREDVGDLRHRTMTGALEWSYALLDHTERRVLRRLSVFVDGCSLAAIEATCAETEDSQEEVLEALSGLVDKSLVDLAGDGRYRLLEITRQYAHAQLVRSGEAERIRERAARYFAEFVAWELRDDGLPRTETSARRVRAEFANVAELLPTLRRLSARDALQLLTRLAHPQMTVGREAELRECLNDAINDWPHNDVARGFGLLARAGLLTGSDPAAGRRDTDEALAIGYELQETALIAAGHHQRAVLALHGGNGAAALSDFDVAVPMIRKLDNPGRLALALAVRAIARYTLGDAAGADRDIADAFAACDRQFDRMGPNRTLILLAAADVAYARSAPAEASAHLREALDLTRQRSLHVRPVLFQGLATIAALEGRSERALRLAGIADAFAGGRFDPQTSPLRTIADRSCVDELERQLGARGLWLRAGGRALSREAAFAYALDEERVALSPRELQVAALVAEGFTSRQIAARLGISERTAEHHVDHILGKLEVRSRTQIARWMADRKPSSASSAPPA